MSLFPPRISTALLGLGLMAAQGVGPGFTSDEEPQVIGLDGWSTDPI